MSKNGYWLFALLMMGLWMPTLSYAKCDTVIECYQQAISDLQHARAEIEKLRQQAAEDAKQIEKFRQSAKQKDEQIDALLTQLNTTAEQVAKLTEAVRVSEDGKVVNTNGSYTLVITGKSCANKRWYAEVDTPGLKQHWGSLLLDIRANFSHCGGGCLWAFRHLEVLFNAFTSQQVLTDTNNNGNGAGEWTITRIATHGEHSEKMRIEKSAGTEKWCGPVDIKIESNLPLQLSKTE